MPNPPSGKKAQKSDESEASKRLRIRSSMCRWEKMDEPAELLGRGLGRQELIGRVAREVGATQSSVRSALKADGVGKRAAGKAWPL